MSTTNKTATTSARTPKANKAKTLVVIESTADIKKAIESIERKGKSLDWDIQRAAVSCLAHINKHGDTTLLDSLVNAMPKGSRKSALVEWAVALGEVRTLNRDNPDDQTAIAQGRIFKLDRTRTFVLENAMASMWYDFKPEKDLLTVFDAQAMVQSMLKRLNNAIRDGADVKNTQAALAAIDQMKQQLAVMDTAL